MKLLIAFCLLGVAVAAPQLNQFFNNRNTNNIVQGAPAQILRYFSDNLGFGGFKYGYQQSDGQAAEAAGELKNEGSQNEALSVTGSYEWIGPDNVNYKVKYTADENGYQPTIEQGPGGGVPPSVVASLLG